MSTDNTKPPGTIEPMLGLQFKYFYVSEAAAMLRVSSQKIYQLIHERKLKAIKPGHAWKISEKALTDYIRSVEYL
jgi:excisionase family DNA binding protein